MALCMSSYLVSKTILNDSRKSDNFILNDSLDVSTYNGSMARLGLGFFKCAMSQTFKTIYILSLSMHTLKMLLSFWHWSENRDAIWSSSWENHGLALALLSEKEKMAFVKTQNSIKCQWNNAKSTELQISEGIFYILH